MKLVDRIHTVRSNGTEFGLPVSFELTETFESFFAIWCGFLQFHNDLELKVAERVVRLRDEMVFDTAFPPLLVCGANQDLTSSLSQGLQRFAPLAYAGTHPILI